MSRGPGGGEEVAVEASEGLSGWGGGLAVLDDVSLGDLGSMELPELVPVSVWAEENVVLSSRFAYAAGPLRLRPWQREPLDVMLESWVRRVVYKFPSQIGKSLLMGILLAYVVCRMPRPILWVLPTEDLRERFLEKRLEPFIQETGVLAARLRKLKRISVEFDSCSLNLPVAVRGQLSQIESGFSFADEVKDFPAKFVGEGSPLDNLEDRMRSYPDSKLVLSSTPMEKGLCEVTRQYDRSDRRVWKVRCGKCGEWFPWDCGQLKWVKRPEGRGRLEWARLLKVDASLSWYECNVCGARVDEKEKRRLNFGGVWVAEGEQTDCAGFTSEILMVDSEKTSIAHVAGEYASRLARREEEGDEVALYHFDLHFRGKSYELKGAKPDEQMVKDRVKGEFGWGDVPEWVELFVGFCDVQLDYVVWTLWGFKRGFRMHLVAHGKGESLEDLGRSVLEMDYPVVRMDDEGRAVRLEKRVRPQGLFIDARHEKSMVLGFCLANQDRYGCWPSMGLDTRSTHRVRAVEEFVEPGLGREGGVIEVYRVDVDYYKTQTWNFLGRPADHLCAMSFHNGVGKEGDDFAREFTSEQRIEVNTRGGRTAWEWKKKPGARANHYWDCGVGSVAFADVVGLFGLGVGEVKDEGVVDVEEWEDRFGREV